MAQVILIESNQTMAELLSINLTTYLGVELIPRQTAQDAIALLTILPTIDLIIARNNIGDEATAQILIEYIKSNNLDTGLIILGKCPPEMREMAKVFDSEKDWEEIIKASAKILGINEETLKKKVVPDFIPIPVAHFLQLDSTNCDVFVRVKKGLNDFQYVRKFKANDRFSAKGIQNYIKQGLTDFYVSKVNQKEFATHVSNQLVTKLEELSFETAKVEDNIEAIGGGHKVLLNQIKEEGVTSSTVQLSEVIINSMEKTVEGFPETSTLLHKIINSKTSTMYQHCFMISVMATKCIKHMKGPKALELQEILTWASFFHDIGFADDEKLIKIQTLEQLGALKTEADIERYDLVHQHALENSMLVSQFPDVPEEIAIIVKEHHGRVDGKGFAESPDPSISFLSKVFIVAEEFAIRMSKRKDEGKDPNSPGTPPQPIIRELYEIYTEPSMVQIVQMLESNLKQPA